MGLLPVAMKIGAKLIGFDLVAVSPLSAPLGNLMYMDYDDRTYLLELRKKKLDKIIDKIMEKKMNNITKTDIDTFKEIYSRIEEKAIRIACVVDNQIEEELGETYIQENGIEVEFITPSGCGCCGDDFHTSFISYDDLLQDVDVLEAKKIEEERLRVKRITDAENLRKAKDKEFRQRQERKLYEELKVKFKDE